MQYVCQGSLSVVNRHLTIIVSMPPIFIILAYACRKAMVRAMEGGGYKYIYRLYHEVEVSTRFTLPRTAGPR